MMAGEIPRQPRWPWLSFLHYQRVEASTWNNSQEFLRHPLMPSEFHFTRSDFQPDTQRTDTCRVWWLDYQCSFYGICTACILSESQGRFASLSSEKLPNEHWEFMLQTWAVSPTPNQGCLQVLNWFFLLCIYSVLRTGSDPKRTISLEIHSTWEAIREQQRTAYGQVSYKRVQMTVQRRQG